MSVKTNNGKEFQIFSVKIKNIGIPYNNPKVEIEGYETNGCCINVVLLRQKNGESTNEDFEFKKGMIQEYALKSTELHPMSSKLLSGCVTAKCPNMNIKISCDDEVITRLPIKLIYPIVIWNHLIKEILFKHIKFFKKYKFLIVENPYFKLKTYLIKC